MIVDVHQHFIALPPVMNEKDVARWADLMVTDIQTMNGAGARSEGVLVPTEQMRQEYATYMPDPDGEKLLARMAKAGIDATVVCVVDNAGRGTSDEKIMALNRRCAEMVRRHPGKLIALASIDPRREAAPELFRHCIEEYGMRGLKWHPDNGYYPNDKAAYDVLKVAEELGVPLLTHTGPLISPSEPGVPEWQVSRLKYTLPMLLDEVAQDFPRLKIVAAHMGGRLGWREWAALAQCRPNLYGDLAMWQMPAMANYDRFCHQLREILDIGGTDSVLFGTDDPFYTPLVPNDKFIQIIRDLPHKAPAGLRFTEEEVEGILGGNARRVFDLKGE